MAKLEATIPNIADKPSRLFRRYAAEGRIGFTAESDETYLPFVIDAIGDDFIMYASDYPHWDGLFPESVSAITHREDLSEESKRKILGANALRLLGPRFQM